ncbi:Holliday junction branch migration protein RuvA [Micrococcales bacterium 31B]|nr:Holliday junction branch migration protein RuvA [Micrococcales bacterium 31B]
MIAYLEGTPVSVSLDHTVLLVGGVGYLVKATAGTLATLRVGEPAALHTSLVVREDSLTLFGFVGPDEREVYELLQTVSGIGPKVALAVLSVLTPDQFRAAVHGGDAATITRVPGIGAKGAQRLLLELKGKVAPPVAATPEEYPGESAAVSDTAVDSVVEALMGLGWNEKASRDAVAKSAEGGMNTSALLRAALRHLGGTR